jgi:hypothetical protein
MGYENVNVFAVGEGDALLRQTLTDLLPVGWQASVIGSTTNTVWETKVVAPTGQRLNYKSDDLNVDTVAKAVRAFIETRA